MKNADRVDLQGKWKRKTRQRGKSVCSEMEERQGTLSAKGLRSWRPNPESRSWIKTDQCLEVQDFPVFRSVLSSPVASLWWVLPCPQDE